MSRQGELLAAMARNRSSNQLRLAYADWLDADGQASRAEFVRLHVRAASCLACEAGDHVQMTRGRGSRRYQVPAAERPRVFFCGSCEACALYDRGSVLLANHFHEWFPCGFSWMDYNGSPAEWLYLELFNRGFIERVKAPLRELRDKLPQLGSELAMVRTATPMDRSALHEPRVREIRERGGPVWDDYPWAWLPPASPDGLPADLFAKLRGQGRNRNRYITLIAANMALSTTLLVEAAERQGSAFPCSLEDYQRWLPQIP